MSMFRVEHNVPEYYINESRDFQLISRLYDLPFQQVRQSYTMLKNTSDTKHCASAMLPLLGTKLGFFETLDLPDKTYREVLSAFPYIIRHKGSPRAIKLIANIFEKLVDTEVECEIYQDHATVKFNKYSPTSELFYRLVDYVRPVGYVINWESYLDLNLEDVKYYQSDRYNLAPAEGYLKSEQVSTVSSYEPIKVGNTDDKYDEISQSGIGFAVVMSNKPQHSTLEENGN